MRIAEGGKVRVESHGGTQGLTGIRLCSICQTRRPMGCLVSLASLILQDVRRVTLVRDGQSEK